MLKAIVVHGLAVVLAVATWAGLAEARTLFARTPSLDEIVDRAHAMVLAAVGRQLAEANGPLVR